MRETTPPSPSRRRIPSWCGAVLLAAALLTRAPAPAAAEEPAFLLIDRDLRTHAAHVLELNDRVFVYLDRSGGRHETPLTGCIALLEPPLATATAPRLQPPGLLRLTDGQRLPGMPAPGTPPAGEVLAWAHAWLGRLNVALEDVSAVSLRRGQPLPSAGRADVVVLANGDRLEGFVSRLGDPIVISQIDESGGSVDVRLDLERAVAAALITPRRSPSGRRVLLRDGTLIDSRTVRVGDDGSLRLHTTWSPPSNPPVQVRLADVRAILFQPRAMTALADLEPTEIEATSPRFFVPAPRELDADAPLGLGPIEYRGPLLVRYPLPEGSRRFAADASRPETGRGWGDYELIVRDDDREVFRARLNDAQPTAAINVELTGSELTIELTPGAHGPILDRLHLERAMILVEAP